MPADTWEKAQLTAEEKPLRYGKAMRMGTGPPARRKMRRPHLTLAERREGVRLGHKAAGGRSRGFGHT